MKTITLCSFLIFILPAVYAQTLNCEWAKSAGGTGNTLPASIATDPSGNSFVTGTFTGPSVTFGSSTLTNAGTTNIFLAKYDGAGNVLWANSGKGNINDYAYKVAADHSGNAIITGCYESSSFILGTDTISTSFVDGNQHVLVAKYDPSGNLLWANHPFRGNASGLALATDAADNIYVTGLFNCSNIAFGTDTLIDTSNLTYGVIFLVKYNSAGDVLWALSSIGTTADAFKSLATDADGNVYATGFVSSPVFTLGGVVLNNTSGSHVVTAKISVGGEVLWVRTTTVNNFSSGNAIATDADGNAYVTGTFQGDTLSFGTVAAYDYAYSDTFYNRAMFLVKYDTSGNAIWAREQGFNQAANEAVTGTGIVTSNGTIYVSGSFYGNPTLVYGADTLAVDTANNGFNVFVAAYDTSGNLLSAASPTGSGSCGSAAIAANDSGMLYICGGYSHATVDFGALPLTNGDSSNAYIAKIAPPAITLVKNVFVNNADINVYPVPCGAFVNVSLPGNGYNALNIYDLSGRAVVQHGCNPAANNMTLNLDLHTLPAGTYLVQAIQNGSRVNRTIVITPN